MKIIRDDADPEEVKKLIESLAVAEGALDDVLSQVEGVHPFHCPVLSLIVARYHWITRIKVDCMLWLFETTGWEEE